MRTGALGYRIQIHQIAECRQALEGFLVDAPLFGERGCPVIFLESNLDQFGSLFPELLHRQCERCDARTSWRRIVLHPHGTDPHRVGGRGFLELVYRCNSCGEAEYYTPLRWFSTGRRTTFTRAGQYPKPQVTPPRELRAALGAQLPDFRSALTLRHHGYGVGALVYLRRMLESLTSELLEMLRRDWRRDANRASDLRDLEDAIKSKTFDRKATLALGALPKELRLPGLNPLKAVYDFMSRALHTLPDRECVGVFDEIHALVTQLCSAGALEKQASRALASGVRRLRGSGSS